jgi:hypothetical protein
MERSRIALLICAVLLIVAVLIPTVTYAEPVQEKTIANDPFLPGNPIDSPFFTKYPPDKFILDAVPADDDDFSTNLYVLTNDFLDDVFYFYMWFCELGIRLVNWAFDIGIAEQLIGIVEEVIPLLKTSVWDQYWYVLFAAGFLGMVFLFGRGEDRSAFNVFVSMFTILCLAPVIFTFWPGFMKQVNEVATYTSGQVLTQMVEVPTLNENGNRSLVFKEQGSSSGRWFRSEKLNRMVEIRKSIHAVDDSLWKAFVYEPYLTLNFGDRALGEKHFEALMSKGTNKNERRVYLEKQGGIDSDGIAKNKQFEIFTADGVKKRMKYVFSATLLSFLPVFALTAFSFVVIYWTLLAVGRAVLMVVHFLLSFWPGYGVSNAAHYLYSTIAALLMKIFYSIVLAVFLRIWIAFNDPGRFPGLNLGGKVILIFLTLWAFWRAVVELREKVMQVRGIFGGQSRLDVGANEMEMVKSRLATAGHVGMRRAQFQLAKSVPRKLSLSKAKKQVVKGYGNVVDMAERINIGKPQQAELNSNLSQEARDVYEKMINTTAKDSDGRIRKLNPRKPSDRREFMKMRPEFKAELHELSKWFENSANLKFDQLPDIENGKVLPPPPPKAGTPEYLIWKENPQLQKQWNMYTQVKRDLHDQAYEEYKKKRTKYENNLFLRMTTKRPRFDQFRPTLRQVAKEYKKRVEAMKKDDKESA